MIIIQANVSCMCVFRVFVFCFVSICEFSHIFSSNKQTNMQQHTTTANDDYDINSDNKSEEKKMKRSTGKKISISIDLQNIRSIRSFCVCVCVYVIDRKHERERESE